MAAPLAPDRRSPPPNADQEPPKPAKLVAIDWSTVALTSEADALALWQKIAPTGDDWEEKLDEVPDDGPIAGQLALALLNGGNFTCVPPVVAKDCVKPPIDIDAPEPTATLSDPCLRRMLALWAISALDDDEQAAAHPAFRTIAAIPPPESQLVAAVLDAFPDGDEAARLELRAIAFRAGHRELVNTKLGTLSDKAQIEAVEKHHIDGPLEMLSAATQRPLFLAAVIDDQLHPSARTQAMTELVALVDTPKLPKDLHTALVTAARASDCSVAAAAARHLVKHGDKKFGPSRPRAKTSTAMMRSLCVLASYEQLQTADEPSYLLGYVPPRGLELVKIAYDPYNDTDTDGDGNPHTERTTITVPKNEVVLPDLEDLVRAMKACTGTTCRSEEREFRFTFKPAGGGELMLSRLEVADRPPCPSTPK